MTAGLGLDVGVPPHALARGWRGGAGVLARQQAAWRDQRRKADDKATRLPGVAWRAGGMA